MLEATPSTGPESTSRWTVFYPWYAKAAILVGYPLLAAAGIYMIYMSVVVASKSTALSHGLTALVPLLMAAAVLYLTVFGYRCFNSMSVRIQLHDDTIELSRDGQIRSYNYSELTLKKYEFAKTRHLQSRDGISLAWLSDSIPNINRLAASIEHHSK